MENNYDFFNYLETNSRPTQCSRIIDYLNEFGSITQLEALRDLGVMRLASRISELNKTYNIKTEFEYGTNRYGEKIKWARYSFDMGND